jgi:putative nucleotidyltransferase with HDIG domain
MALPEGLMQRIENLAPMPVTAQRLLSVLHDENVSLSEIARIVEFDEALVSNTLRVANSVYFSRTNPVTSARAAVVRLGTTNLFNLILGQHLRQISIPAPLYDLTENELWFHSTVASLAVDEIARTSPVEIPQVARIAALVHDVGKLIIVRYFKNDFRSVLAHAEETGKTFVEAEREVLGCDHAEVGAEVAREWGFPDEVRYAIEYHHSEPPEGPTPVLDAVVIANLVAKTMAAGLGAEGFDFKIDEGSRRRLELDFGKFCRICSQVEDQMQQVKTAFGLN